MSSLTGNVWSGLVLQECVGSFAYFTLTGFSTGASRHDSIQFNPTQPDSTRLSSRQRQLNYVAVLITIRAAATRSYHSLTQANPCPPPLSLPPLLSSSSSSLSAASATSSVSIDAAALRRLLLLLLLSAPSVATCPRSLPASALSARERGGGKGRGEGSFWAFVCTLRCRRRSSQIPFGQRRAACGFWWALPCRQTRHCWLSAKMSA